MTSSKSKKYSYIDDARESTVEVDPAGYMDYRPFGEGNTPMSESDRVRCEEVRNYLDLRMRYYRDVKPKGWRWVLHNPFPFAGLAVAIGSFIMTVRNKDDRSQALLWRRRWTATVFAVVTIGMGIILQQMEERRWMRRAASLSIRPLDENDFSRSMYQLMALNDKCQSYYDQRRRVKEELES